MSNDKKTMFCFINQTFSNDKGELKLFQIITNYEQEFEVKSRLLDLDELKEFYTEYKKNKFNKFDFEITGDYLRCENIPNTVLSDIELEQNRNSNFTYKPIVPSIYDLFTDIVNCEGKYIDKTVEDKLGTDLIVEGCSDFIPIYSESTMTVHIPVKLGQDGWKSRKLIYVDNGKLVTDDFIFIVDSKYKDEFLKYDIDYIDDFQFRELNYSAFRYTGNVPIYAYTSSQLKIIPSILNRYCYMSTLYKSVMKTADYIASVYSAGLEGKTAEEEKATPGRSNYISKYTNYYVTLTLSTKAVTQERRNIFITDILTNVLDKLVANTYTIEDVIKRTRDYHLDTMEKLVYLTTVEIFFMGGSILLDRLAYARKVAKQYKIYKFRVDTFLYMIRSCLFSMKYNLGEDNRIILRGSDVPYETVLKRRTLHEINE